MSECVVCGRPDCTDRRCKTGMGALSECADRGTCHGEEECYRLGYERLTRALSAERTARRGMREALERIERDSHDLGAGNLARAALAAEPGEGPAAGGDALRVLRDALYEDGYSEMTTAGRVCRPHGHSAGCGNGPPHICECWVFRAWRLLPDSMKFDPPEGHPHAAEVKNEG